MVDTDDRPRRSLAEIAKDPVAHHDGCPDAAVHHGHTIDQGATVIQFHMVGMYAAALVSGRLAQRPRHGHRQLLGTAVMAIGLVVIVLGSSQLHLVVALGVVGVGWNLMYVTSSALIAASYRESERSHVQAIGSSAPWVARRSAGSPRVYCWKPSAGRLSEPDCCFRC